MPRAPERQLILDLTKARAEELVSGLQKVLDEAYQPITDTEYGYLVRLKMDIQTIVDEFNQDRG